MKKILILIVALSLTLLTGCQQETTGLREDPYVGGTSAIQMNFMSEQPPVEVFDNGASFSAAIEIQNVGEYKVDRNDFKVKLVGVSPNFIGWDGNPKSPNINLEKTTKDSNGVTREGIRTNIVFGGLRVTESVAGGVAEYPKFRAVACYKYGTQVSVIGCINENFFDTKVNPICEARAANTVFNSGAPVHITSVEQTPVDTNIVQFIITIEKTGSGNVYARGNDCNTDNYFEENLIWFEIPSSQTFQRSNFECAGLVDINQNPLDRARQGYATLYKSTSGQPKATINCYLKLDSREKGDYESPFNINLEYQYQDYVQKNLVVRHIGGYGG